MQGEVQAGEAGSTSIVADQQGHEAGGERADSKDGGEHVGKKIV